MLQIVSLFTIIEIVVFVGILAVAVGAFIGVFFNQRKKAIAKLKAEYGGSAWTTPPPVTPTTLNTPTNIVFNIVSTRTGGVRNIPVTFTLGGTANPAATFSGGSRTITVNTDHAGDATTSLINARDGDDKVTVTFKITTSGASFTGQDATAPPFEVEE